MSIKSDWHIHTHCSCDSACMEFETLVREAEELGITDFGVSDHYHTRLNEPDIAASRRGYDTMLEKYPHLKGRFHFGIEATVVSAWEVDKIARGECTEYAIRDWGAANTPVILDFDEEFLERYGIEYVVTGVHWPTYCATDVHSLVKEYHRQYMYAATHPFTDIMAHYLWWDKGVFPIWGVYNAENPFLDFSVISQDMRSELEAALLEHHTAFELNICMIHPSCLPESFRDEYLGWVAQMQRNGVRLAFGSDTHAPRLSNTGYGEVEKILKHYGIDTESLYSHI